MSIRDTLTGKRSIGLTALAFFSLCCGGQSLNVDRNRNLGNNLGSNSPAEQRSIKKPWEDIYFEAIDARTMAAELSRLRDTEGPQNSLEIRIWAGVDFSSLRGFVLRRTGDQWSAMYLPSSEDLSKPAKQVVPLSGPMSGWASFWEELNRQDILTLPDAQDAGADNINPDALGIVVEIRSNGSYRAYNYNGYDTSEHVAAKKVNNICKTITKEFKLVLC